MHALLPVCKHYSYWVNSHGLSFSLHVKMIDIEVLTTSTWKTPGFAIAVLEVSQLWQSAGWLGRLLWGRWVDNIKHIDWRGHSRVISPAAYYRPPTTTTMHPWTIWSAGDQQRTFCWATEQLLAASTNSQIQSFALHYRNVIFSQHGIHILSAYRSGIQNSTKMSKRRDLEW